MRLDALVPGHTVRQIAQLAWTKRGWGQIRWKFLVVRSSHWNWKPWIQAFLAPFSQSKSKTIDLHHLTKPWLQLSFAALLSVANSLPDSYYRTFNLKYLFNDHTFFIFIRRRHMSPDFSLEIGSFKNFFLFIFKNNTHQYQIKFLIDTSWNQCHFIKNG